MAPPVSTDLAPMEIAWDVAIPMADGSVLRANVYRPPGTEPVPAIATLGPYGKDMPMSVTYPEQWRLLERDHADVLGGSTGRYLVWEMPDPERWTPHGYAIVHIDARGMGRSPGIWAPFSQQETTDFVEVIEWVAAQPWCTGRVGVLGVSYHAMAAWRVAARQPPHLAAIIPWFGSGDAYREAYRHGGILSNSFIDAWFYRWIRNQHGVASGPTSPLSGERSTGPELLSDAELERSRVDLPAEVRSRQLLDDWMDAQAVDWAKVVVPLLSVGSWGSVGLHLRGNVEAFRRGASPHKWLVLLDAQGPGIDRFFSPHGVGMQRRFFDRFLKAADDGWSAEPPVTYEVHGHDGRRSTRTAATWPIERTRWTRLHLSVTERTMGDGRPPAPGQVTYWPTSDGLTLRSTPFADGAEIVGPMALHLETSTQAPDLDIFATVRVLDADRCATAALARGWLRLSHRELDDEMSTPWAPVHVHRRLSEVVAGRRYAIEVEIWPAALAVPPGGSLALNIVGRDGFDTGEWRHNDPDDRPNRTFAGWATIYSDPEAPSWLLVPVVAADPGPTPSKSPR